MAAGNTLLFTPVGGLTEALVDGENGFLVKSIPPNSKEISKKILQLMENQELMVNISKNNVKKVKEKYDVKVITNQISSIYQDLNKKG